MPSLRNPQDLLIGPLCKNPLPLRLLLPPPPMKGKKSQNCPPSQDFVKNVLNVCSRKIMKGQYWIWYGICPP